MKKNTKRYKNILFNSYKTLYQSGRGAFAAVWMLTACQKHNAGFNPLTLQQASRKAIIQNIIEQHCFVAFDRLPPKLVPAILDTLPPEKRVEISIKLYDQLKQRTDDRSKALLTNLCAYLRGCGSDIWRMISNYGGKYATERKELSKEFLEEFKDKVTCHPILSGNKTCWYQYLTQGPI